MSLFSESERRALEPPPPETVTEWAERCVRLTAEEGAAEPGPYRVERVPFAREILDTAADPDVEEIVLLKSVQITGSTMTRIILGYWMDLDPGPALLVFPDESSAREAIEDRILPMIRSSDVLRTHVTRAAHDLTKLRVRLDTMSLYSAWATSPQSLATRPCRYVVFDETDKYVQWSARDADPISLGTRRTTTWAHRRKILKLSTCTTRQGNIWTAWQQCADRRTFHVPCPECRAFGMLQFANIHWPKRATGEEREAHADRVYANSDAWYSCPECGAELREREKAGMLAAGVWASEGQTVLADGGLEGERPPSKAVGFRISALYSPWVSWAEMVSVFLKAGTDPARLMDFRNNFLAEPFEQVEAAPKLEAVRAKVRAAKEADAGEGRVPAWTGALVATADVQLDHFFVVIRAWGYRFKSRLIWAGRVEGSGELGFDRLRAATIESVWPIEGRDPKSPGASVSLLMVDAGFRTDEVYQFASTMPEMIYPIRGHGGQRKAASPIRRSEVSYHVRGDTEPRKTYLHVLDVELFKDRLSRYMKAAEGEEGEWLLHAETTEEYCRHMVSEHKVLVKESRQSPRSAWIPVATGTPNHY